MNDINTQWVIDGKARREKQQAVSRKGRDRVYICVLVLLKNRDQSHISLDNCGFNLKCTLDRCKSLVPAWEVTNIS